MYGRIFDEADDYRKMMLCWQEQELPAVQLNPDSPIAMASDQQTLMAVWREKGTSQLKFITGGYRRE